MSEKFVVEIDVSGCAEIKDLQKEIKVAISRHLPLKQAGFYARKLSATETILSDLVESLRNEIRESVDEKMNSHEYHHDHTRNDRY